MQQGKEYRVSADVGGTFTDIVLLQDGTLSVKKVLSTPADFSEAVLEGLQAILEEEAVSSNLVKEIVNGTTVACNAIIEKKGAVTGLITTNGFRDVLEIRRMRCGGPYDMMWEKPKPLVERYMRREVKERITAKGEVWIPIDLNDVERAIEEFLSLGVESVAISFINSYVNPIHEEKAMEVIRQKAPQVYLSVSSQVQPEIKEYERTSTTVIEAYLKPVMVRYIGSLQKGLRDRGFNAPLLVMQSNGGIMTAEVAMDRPAHTAESGPAAGVIAVTKLGQRMGEKNLISFDMGGTTAKLSSIENFSIDFSDEFEIGGEATGGWRFAKGSGHLLRVPVIELAEVGSGGGSIAWIDPGGILKVGPTSAGADPGPACYDRGGTEPTITDANVVLGYFNPEYLVGGSLGLNAPKASEAIETKVAHDLKLGLEEAAYGIRTIANALMVRAVKMVTVGKARNPRDFIMVAFGGCGPAHAVDVAGQLGIKRVIIPPLPGAFSSLGLLFADVEHHSVMTYWRDIDKLDFNDINERLEEVEADSVVTLQHEGFDRDRIELKRSVEMRYHGQNFQLSIPMRAKRFSEESVKELSELFAQEHERSFGYRSNEVIQIFRLRFTARGIPMRPRVPEQLAVRQPTGITARQRRAYFGPEHRWLDTPILRRDDLRGKTLAGPIIIEEYDATTVVPRGAWATLDKWGNIVIDVGEQDAVQEVPI